MGLFDFFKKKATEEQPQTEEQQEGVLELDGVEVETDAQDADIVLFLYREDYYSSENEPGQETDRNSGECIVAKNRHGEAKTVPLHWQGEFMRFTAQEVVHHAP